MRQPTRITSWMMPIFLVLLVLPFCFAEEYPQGSIRYHEDKPVDIHLNDGKPLRIRPVFSPRELLQLTPDEQDQFDSDYTDETWDKSALRHRMGTLFEGNALEDNEEAPNARRPWEPTEIEYTEDLAGKKMIRQVENESTWHAGGIQTWEKPMASQSNISTFFQKREFDDKWNIGVGPWLEKAHHQEEESTHTDET